MDNESKSLVERLRERAARYEKNPIGPDGNVTAEELREASDEIAQLERERDEAKESKSLFLFDLERAENKAKALESALTRLKAPLPDSRTTAEELAEWRRLSDNATAGPWSTKKPGLDADGWSYGVIVAAVARGQGVYAQPPGGSFPAADQDFIAAARDAMPRLLDDLDAYAAQARSAAELMEPIADALDEDEQEAKRPDRVEIWETPTAMAIELGHVRAIKRYVETIRASRKGETNG